MVDKLWEIGQWTLWSNIARPGRWAVRPAAVVGQILETALDVELTEELGYDRHERSESTNNRNGSSKKTVQTDVGPVTIDVPRDRNGSFDPVIVSNHARRLSGID